MRSQTPVVVVGVVVLLASLLPAAVGAQVAAAPVVVAGGPAAVSDGVVASLTELVGTPVPRVAGDDRYATAAAAAEAFGPGVPVLVASGEGYADALAGGPLATVMGGPILLTRPGELPEATAASLERLAPSSITVLGGEAAVSAAVAEALEGLTAGPVARLAGADRYATAATVAAALPGPVEVAFIASGEAFPDALAGSAVAGAQGAPILLTRQGDLPAATSQALADLTPERIVVLGGVSAVSAAVEAQLAGLATVERLGGADRFATAAVIAAAGFPDGADVLYVASGATFADALAIAPVAAGAAGGGFAQTGGGQGPVLLTDPDVLPDEVRDAVRQLLGLPGDPTDEPTDEPTDDPTDEPDGDNGAPTVVDVRVTTAAGQPVAVTLLASDPDGDPVTFALASAPGHGTAVLSGDGVTYTPAAGFTGTDSFTYTASDGELTSAPATVTVTVRLPTSPGNPPPVVNLDPGGPDAPDLVVIAPFTEGAGPVDVVGAGATVDDPDGTTLSSLTATLTATPDGADEGLAVDVTATPSLEFAYDPGTGTLAVTPVAPATDAPEADFQTVLRTLAYDNADQDPDTIDRVIMVVAEDAAGAASTPATTTTGVVAVDDAPTVSVPGAQTTDEDTALVFSTVAGNAISVVDVDAGAGGVEVALTATDGTVSLLAGAAGPLAFTIGDGTDDATMAFRGTVAQVNAALDGMTFAPTANLNGPASLAVDVDDLGNSGTGGPLTDSDTVAITVTAVNDAPVIALPGAQTTPEGTALTLGAGSGNQVSVADVDAGSGDLEAVLTATDGTVSLLPGALGALAFTAGDGVDDVTVTFEGTLAEVNAALDGMTLDPAADFNGPASLVIDVDDLGNSGAGGALTDSDTVDIEVTAVNDAPSVDLDGAAGGIDFAGAFTEDGGPVAIASAPTVTDVDDSDMESATITLTNPDATDGDSLTLTGTFGAIDPGSISGSDGDIITITGPAPSADFEAAIAAIRYANPSENPTTADRIVTVVVDDGDVDSATATATVTVTRVNDAPVVDLDDDLSGVDFMGAFTGGGPAVPIADNPAVTDVDDTDVESATITLTNPDGTDGDHLTLTGTFGAIGAGFITGSGTDVITITRPAPSADYAAAIDALRYTNPSALPSTTARDITVVVNDGDADSAVATATLAILRGPIAMDDTFQVAPTVALNGDVTDDNGSGADYLGEPAGELEFFGGGSMGGSVGDREVDSTPVPFAGGTLTLDPDGTFTLTNPAEGTYTFDYQLTNSVASDVATVTVVVQRPPVLVDDAFTTTTGATLNGDLHAANPTTVDDLGAPAGTLTHFGGGDAGGTVTTNAAGATVAFAGGTLTVDGDGSFALANPTTGGVFTFEYRVTAAAAVDDATVTVTVQHPPTAIDDAPTAASAPGDAFHTGLDQTFTVNAAAGLLANDTRGSPLADVVSFGGGDLGGDVDTNAASDTATVGTAGSLTVNADGSVSFTPDTGFTGLFDFEYRITNAAGTDTGTVSIGVGVRPSAAGDTYTTTLIGNVAVDTSVSTGFSTLANDSGDGLTAVNATATNGTVTLDPDGTFTFTPNRGYVGPASFTYQASNGFGANPTAATVTLTVGTPLWVIDAAAAAGDGTPATPYSTLAAFHAANDGAGTNPAANDVVFIADHTSAYTGPLTLLDGQRLIGEDATGTLASLSGLTVPADSTGLPTTDAGADADVVEITSAAAGLTVALGNRLHGFQLGNVATGAALVGTGYGTLVVSDVSIDTTGAGINLDTGSAGTPFAFSSVSSSGGTTNVRIVNAGTGTYIVGGGALSGSSGIAVEISGGTASTTYSGTITNAANRSLSVTNKTGGVVDLLGAIADTGTGILLNSNPGTTVNLTGGVNLTTGTNAAFTATGGGTVTVTGSTNALTTTTGTALNVTNTTIGGAGLTFRSISSDGGSSPGIVLNTTGTLGGLTVTGSSSGACGGNVVHSAGVFTVTAAQQADCTGGVITNKTVDGISLQNTSNVTLTRMDIRGNAGSGIFADDVTNLVISDSRIASNADTATGAEAGIRANELLGTGNTLTRTTVSGSSEDNVRITPASGSFTLAVTGSTLGPNSAATGGHGIAVIGTGAAAPTLSVTSSHFPTVRSTGVLVNLTDTGAGTTTITNNNFQDVGAAVTFQTSASADLTFTVSGNNVVRAISNAIQLVAGSTGSSTSLIRGAVDNNVIGDGTADSGSRDMFGIALDLRGQQDAILRVSGNNVRNTDIDGIWISVADFASGGPLSPTGPTDVTLTNNTVGTPDDNSAFPFTSVYGMLVDFRHDTVGCLNINGNNSSHVGGATDIRVRQRNTSTFRLQGYGGAATDMTAVQNYVSGANSNDSVLADFAGGGFTSATCRTIP